MEGENAPLASFATAAEADRRIAGVAAAARRVRLLSEAGAGLVRLRIGDGAALASTTIDDVERLRGRAVVEIERGAVIAGDPAPSAWAIVRATAKPGDGLVSRWLNRPISQRISALLLRIEGARPIHVTIFNGGLAVVMLAMLLFGGQTGLLLGAVLFHTASVLDGVDGEMARATFRTSAEGATLDSAIDMATNFLFLIGITVNLGIRDRDEIILIGLWGMVLMAIGAVLIARRNRAGGGALGFDLLKRWGPVRGLFDSVYWVVQVLSSRDCFAFLFMALTLVGLERVALSIFSGVANLWIAWVLVTMIPRPAGARATRDA